MPTPRISQAEAQRALSEVVRLVKAGTHRCGEVGDSTLPSAVTEAARQMGRSEGWVRRRIESLPRWGMSVEAALEFKSDVIEDDDLGDGLSVILGHMGKNDEYITGSRRGTTRRIIVRPEPFAIAFLGDPHIDNKGTDLKGLYRDVEALRASGTRAVNVGDILDFFQHRGKLAEKQAHNRMTVKEGMSAARWLVRDSGVRWDAHILGNHDAWAGSNFASLMAEWARAAKHPSRIYDWMVRLVYAWGDGPGEQFSTLVAHDFKGHSIYNPLHGLFRRALEDGADDLYVAGHRHTAAEGSFENGFRGKQYTFLRVKGYKQWDDYAYQRGFPMQEEGAAALAVINPLSESKSGRCRTFPNILDGLEYLNSLRMSHAA